MKISASEINEKIVEAPQTAAYKKYHKKKNIDCLPVLKIPKADSRLAYQKAEFRQNIKQLKALQATSVMTPGFLSDKFGQCCVTQNCFNGVALDKLIEDHYEKSAYDL